MVPRPFMQPRWVLRMLASRAQRMRIGNQAHVIERLGQPSEHCIPAHTFTGGQW